MAVTIRYLLRNDTAANWETVNPVLLKGEPGYNQTDAQLKFGDGTTPWKDLPGVGGFVKGMIMMWSGAANAVPQGWGLCDGQDGRPNLIGRFVRGAANAGGTGGADSVSLTAANLPAHTHAMNHTHSGSSHSHNISLSTGAQSAHTHDFFGPAALTSSMGPPALATAGAGSAVTDLVKVSQIGHVSTTSTDGAHSHSVSGSTAAADGGVSAYSGNTGSVGSGTAVSTLPTYYELAFIVKL